jgi:hypothetical protein
MPETLPTPSSIKFIGYSQFLGQRRVLSLAITRCLRVRNRTLRSYSARQLLPSMTSGGRL